MMFGKRVLLGAMFAFGAHTAFATTIDGNTVPVSAGPARTHFTGYSVDVEAESGRLDPSGAAILLAATAFGPSDTDHAEQSLAAGVFAYDRVPEPASFAFLGTGMIAAAGIIFRKRRVL